MRLLLPPCGKRAGGWGAPRALLRWQLLTHCACIQHAISIYLHQSDCGPACNQYVDQHVIRMRPLRWQLLHHLRTPLCMCCRACMAMHGNTMDAWLYMAMHGNTSTAPCPHHLLNRLPNTERLSYCGTPSQASSRATSSRGSSLFPLQSPTRCGCTLRSTGWSHPGQTPGLPAWRTA